MADDIVIIRSKILRAGKRKEEQYVDRKTYDGMVANGTIRNFDVLSTATAKPAEDHSKKIEEFTKIITGKQTPVLPETDAKALLKLYRSTVKTDKVAAKAILLKLNELIPENKFVKEEMKTNK